MVDLTNTNNSGDTQQVQEQKQQQCFTRSDVATTRRAIQDLKGQSEKLKSSLSQSLAMADNTSMDEFQSIWNKREQLNQVNTQVKELEQSLNEIMPSLSKAKLSDEEKKRKLLDSIIRNYITKLNLPSSMGYLNRLLAM
ncbi:hypothetical protein HJ144_24440 [Vibrio parahaemolyticus]|nr:hypothetical protein [Vibrio parahaemolyticus]